MKQFESVIFTFPGLPYPFSLVLLFLRATQLDQMQSDLKEAKDYHTRSLQLLKYKGEVGVGLLRN